MREAQLPPLYAGWLRDLLGGPIPEETVATCDRCPMLPSAGTAPHALTFHPSAKCCSFHPALPNFLAGRILADPDPAIAEGKRILLERIAQRVAVAPSGVGAGGVFELLYRKTPGVFGRAPALKCPYLGANGACGVWKSRPGVCATWFCKHVRGDVGFRFWKLMDRLLREVEGSLALWCLAERNAGAAEIDEPMISGVPNVAELGGAFDEARYRAIWGELAGREAEHYEACAGLVESLSWERVLEICGPLVRHLAARVRGAYADLLSEAVPERLRVAEFRLVRTEGAQFELLTYSEFDPVLMSLPLMRMLPFFDGRPTREALDAIRAELGGAPDLALVRRMVDFGVLQAC